MLEEDDNMEKSNTLRVPQIPISRLSSNSSHSAESGFGGSNSDLSLSGFQTENKYSRRHSFSVTGFTNAFSFPENVLSETIMKRSPSMIDMMNFEENIKIFKEDSTIPEKEISIEYLRKIIEQGIQRKNKRLIETALSLASDNNMKIICREFCKKKPQVCFVSHTIMKKIKHRVITEFRNKCEILSVWIGRNVKKASGIDTIVLVTKAPKPCVMSNYFWGLYLKIRCASECSTEASHLLVHDMNDLNGSLGIQIKDIEINKLLICHSNITLIKTSNVCSIGFKRKTHRIEWVPSIVIYCHVKGVIPIGENAFPTRIGGHRVDVREAVCEFSGQPAQISEQIGSEDMKTTGTLGGFVTLQNPNRHAFLTCAHVVLPSDVLKKGRAIEYTKRRDIKVLTKNA
ncbi:uncharacterized protein LOC134251798 [Saccostrea cucullata]|uniref:uncharacterized protein LOC134251798 n=1 Tax=Saccostrea cuccullata TaxID=36930 RepID=UPI002ED27880